MTGYVLAKEAWGFGYATEALNAIACLGDALEIGELFALCHRDHRASHRVLEKRGFVGRPKHIEATNFPTLGTSLAGSCTDALCYIRKSGFPEQPVRARGSMLERSRSFVAASR